MLGFMEVRNLEETRNLSQKSFDIDNGDQNPRSKGWELETATGTVFTWKCDQTHHADETPGRDSHSNQSASTHNNGISEVDLYRNYHPTHEYICDSKWNIDDDESTSNPQQDDILGALEEYVGLKSPLEMRELPDLTHGFATWNVCNGFDANQILTIMLKCNLSVLFIQEPRSKFDEIEVGFSKKILLQHGIKAAFSKHQYLLFNERALGARISNIKTQMEGRLISCDLQIGPLSENTFIRLHGCYAVTQGNKLYKDGFTREQRRKQLHKIVMTALKQEKKYIGAMLMGDLQETITMTSRDNKGGHSYARMKFGVLDAIDQSSRSMCSAVYEYESDEQSPYITRNELSKSNSGRGITHIMVTSKVEEMYVGGCVDNILSCSSIMSDHHLVAADLIIDIPTPPKHSPNPTKRIRWGKISSIKVEPIYEDDESSLPSSIVPLRNTPHTDEWKAKVAIFQEIQRIAGEGSQLDQDVAETFLNEMTALQEDLRQKSKLLTKADQLNGKLIARHPGYKNRLEKAYRMFKRGTIEMAKTLKFVSEEDPLDKMDKKIKDKKDFKDACGNASSSGTFTSVINHGRHLRAMAKALQQTAKKALATNIDEVLYKDHMRRMQHFAQRLILLGDQYRLGDRLVDAIELAEYQQSEKVKIQDVYQNRRGGTLDKFQGELRGKVKVDLDKSDIDELNVLLTEAECNHLLNSDTVKDCQIRDDEDSKNWNKVKIIYEEYDEGKRWIDMMSDKKFHDAIRETVTALEAISRSAAYQRRKFKLLHIRHAALTMSTKDLSRLLLPQAGDLPEPQMTIIDEETGLPRPCESDEEVLKATNIKEQAYMTPLDVKRQIHFGQPTEDEVGLNGIQIENGRAINDENMAKTFPKYNKLDKNVQYQIKEAHEYMRQLFESPLSETKDLNYPFSLDCDSGEFSDELLAENFYKAIISEPGSNRHEGYHLSVLGRMPNKWQKGMLLFLQNVLITRCPPPAIKEMSRILIPKGDKKPGQTRPISMADDTFSFLTNEISNRMAIGMEETGRLGDEIKAYRKGKSTSDITVEQRLILEEALEYAKYLGIVQEDEEKFFDKPAAELQLMVMKLFGFPFQGYMEWKAEDMLDRIVHVITRYGITLTQFLTGVPQGSTLSVYIANLIIWVKHKVMRLDEAKGLVPRKNPFKFKVWDTGDERPIRLSISYCDDNDGYHGAKNLKMLKNEIEKQVRMTGYFSIVTRLGRIGSKSQIYVYNVDPNVAEEIMSWTFEAYAWSHAAGTVIKEETPVVYHFQKTPVLMKGLSPTNLEAIRILEKRHGITKHLGVTYRTDRPDYTETGIRKCNQAIARLSRLNFRSIDDKAIAIIINTFITSYAQFAALEADVKIADLNKVDRAIINKVRRGYSLAKCDMKEVMLIPHRQLGMNIRSFLGTMLAAKPRELECRLNGEDDCAVSMRARWRSWAQRKPDRSDHNSMEWAKRGLLESNVKMEALFGIYLRDKRYHLCNIMMDSILMDFMDGSLKTKMRRIGAPIGHEDFRRTTTGVLGEGDETLLSYATFSTFFNEIRLDMEEIELMEGAPKWGRAETWIMENNTYLQKHNIDGSRLATYARQAIEQVQKDTTSTVAFAEWLGEEEFTTECPNNALTWAQGTQMWTIPNKCEDYGVITMDSTAMEQKILDHYGKNKKLGADGNGPESKTLLWDMLNDDNTSEGKMPMGIGSNHQLFKQLSECHPPYNEKYRGRKAWFQMEDREELIRRYYEDKGCPYFLAEDGGNYTMQANGEDRGAKVVVLWAPQMNNNENFEDIMDTWQDRQAIPLAARAYPLPKCIGTETTHCGHSEIGALNMGIEWFDEHDPCLHVLDSNATAFNARSMRDEPTPSMRRRIRGRGVAAGKGECERLRKNIRKLKEPSGRDLRTPWNHRQRVNLQKIIEAMQEWNQPKWPRQYRDHDTAHPIMLVDSHQLDDKGKLTGQRYKTMVPCRAMVTANELADKICMVILGIKGSSHCLQTIPTPEDIRYPPNTLRFTFSNMGKTFNGDTPATIERLVRDTLWRAAASKQEQGRILRILEKVNLTAAIIGRKGALSNLLRHLAQSHSQNYYRNGEYAKLHDKYGNVPKVKGKQLQKELSTLCPFCKHLPNQYQAKANTRHYHVYCPNKRISHVRNKTAQCLEKLVSEFNTIAAEIKEIAIMETILWEDLNRGMNEITTNDCGLRKGKETEGPEGIEGAKAKPYTLHNFQLQRIYNDQSHRLFTQVRNLPFSSGIGLITSRAESEWQDSQTTSSDLIFLGATPNVAGDMIQAYCNKALKQLRREDVARCKDKCNNLKDQWRKVESFTRVKATIIQKAISAQLQQYKKELQKKERESEDCENSEDEESDEDEKAAQAEDKGVDKVTVSRICIGKKCYLLQTPKQFISTGPKKCCVCRTFEPALNKCLEVENYLVTQLAQPEVDVDMFKMLQGLSGLMVESKGRQVKNLSYFEEMLQVPIIKKVLKDPKLNKKGVYKPSAIKPMEMLAATFGIALVRGTGNPFPTLTLEEARELWKKDNQNTGKRDQWDQIKWCIQNNSIGDRLRKLEGEIKHIDADVKIVLARAGKVAKVRDRPYSITTSLPRRTKGIWDENVRKCKDKIDTTRIAIKLRQPLSPAAKRRIQQETQRKTQQEETLFQQRIQQKKRTKIPKTINKEERNKGGKCRARSDVPNVEEQQSDNPSPKKSARTARTRIANIESERTDARRKNEERTQNMATIEIESSGDEQEPITNAMISRPTLYHLKEVDLTSILHKGRLMRGTCVQAITEIIHGEKRREDITCVSSDFYSYIMQNKIEEAKRLLHTDDDKGCQDEQNEARQTPPKKKRIATAMSKILLIPCHDNGGVQHWFLTIRCKHEEGKHTIIIIDSLGHKTGKGRISIIKGNLKKVNLIGKKDRCIAMNTVGQTERECGIRMAAYMTLFRSLDVQHLNTEEIINRTNRYVAHERNFTDDLAARRRADIHRMLETEQKLIRKGV